MSAITLLSNVREGVLEVRRTSKPYHLSKQRTVQSALGMAGRAIKFRPGGGMYRRVNPGYGSSLFSGTVGARDCWTAHEASARPLGSLVRAQAARRAPLPPGPPRSHCQCQAQARTRRRQCSGVNTGNMDRAYLNKSPSHTTSSNDDHGKFPGPHLFKLPVFRVPNRDHRRRRCNHACDSDEWTRPGPGGSGGAACQCQ
jgi:hypothetical protein